MPEDSILRGALSFLDRMGVYDIVLPFLMVFTLVFAILEKTRILGTHEVGGNKYSKKDLNAMFSFCVAFFVIASAQLVEVIAQVSGQMVIFLLAVILFLLLIGTFYKEGEDVALEGGWRVFMMVVLFIGIVFMFLNAIKTDGGQTWLEVIWYFLGGFWTSQAIATLLFVIFIILFIAWLTHEPKMMKKHDHDH